MLGLPAELRDQIYRYALISNEAISLDNRRGRAHIELSLLAVSHQFRSETVKMFYSENTFAAPDTAYAEKWLDSLGEDRMEVITSLRAFHPGAAVGAAENLPNRWREYLRKEVQRIVTFSGRGLVSESAVLIPLPFEGGIVWATMHELDDFEVAHGNGRWPEVEGFKRKDAA